MFLAFLLGEAEAAALQRLLDGLRAPESPLRAQVRSMVPAILTGLALLMPSQQLLQQTPPTFCEACSTEAHDADAARRHIQRVEHAASPVLPPAPLSALRRLSCQRFKRCRDCNPCGAPQLPEASDQGPPTPLDTSDVEQPAPPPNAHGEASDLHLANIAGLAAASQARARADAGAGVAVAGAGALQRPNLRFSCLLRLALNLRSRRTTTPLAAQRHRDALQLLRRASAQDWPPRTPFPW